VLRCPACSGIFETQVPDKVFCSVNCKKRAKRRRQAAQRPAAAPPPRRSPCLDCGVTLAHHGPGKPVQRCAACRAVRIQRKAQERRRSEHAAVRAILAEVPRWRRLLEGGLR
jgi:hypothetical protein